MEHQNRPLQGFVKRSNNLGAIEIFMRKKQTKEEFIFAKIQIRVKYLLFEEEFRKNVPKLTLNGLQWKKRMRWGDL